MASENIVVLVTTPASDIAGQISQLLLEKKKAACVNIISNINSSFWWQGKIETQKERLLIIKTRTDLLDDIIKMVKKVHPDKVPEIISLPVVGGNPDYLKWMNEALDKD